MHDAALVTETEFAKSEAAFRSVETLRIEPAPAAEADLAEAVRRRNARAVIVGTVRYTGPLYEALGQESKPDGALIARFGVGHDSVDKALARRHGIIVTNTPGVLDVSVAEHVFWLLGALLRHVAALDAEVKTGAFRPHMGVEVAGKTLGIVGLGRIGRRVARTAHFGFGMRVVAADVRTPGRVAEQEDVPFERFCTEHGLAEYTTDVRPVLERADVVSIHLPANDETRHFFGSERLGWMRPGAVLLNTARGSIVDEAALYDALAEGRLAGAALDVFENEPYEPVSPQKDLRRLPNAVLTPHVGSNTREANRRMAERCLRNVAGFFAGRLDEIDRVDVEGD
jgi:lactate dehydrogenase-like 2-hydroxyacid dehydrogenase